MFLQGNFFYFVYFVFLVFWFFFLVFFFFCFFFLVNMLLTEICEGCYESFPCQHYVTFENGDRARLRSPQIWQLLVEQNFTGGAWTVNTLVHIALGKHNSWPESRNALATYIRNLPVPADNTATLAHIGQNADPDVSFILANRNKSLPCRRTAVLAQSNHPFVIGTPFYNNGKLVSVRASQPGTVKVMLKGVAVSHVEFDAHHLTRELGIYCIPGDSPLCLATDTPGQFVVNCIVENIPPRIVKSHYSACLSYLSGTNEINTRHICKTVWVRRADGSASDSTASLLIDDQVIPLTCMHVEAGGWLRHELQSVFLPTDRLAINASHDYLLCSQHEQIIEMPSFT